MDCETWCVTFMDDSTKEVIPLRQSSWSCKVQHSLGGDGDNRKCDVPAGDSEVSVMPLAGEPYQRAELAKPANKYQGYNGVKQSVTYPDTQPSAE